MKLIIVLLALVVVASCAPLTNKHYQFLFERYQEKHNKKYTEDEVAFRFANFKENLDKVRAHNARKDVSFTVAMNHLCDLSRDEYLGLLTPMTVEGAQYVPSEVSGVEGWDVDWRNKGAVTPIKDQGQCGSCWAFSTVAAIEGAYAIKFGNLKSFSESNIVDCDTSTCYGCNGCWPYVAMEWVHNNGGIELKSFSESNIVDCDTSTCYGCNGCWPYVAMEWVHNNGGIELESDYPYHAYQSNCRDDKSKHAVTIQGYKNVQKGSESDLCNVCKANGPVSVAIDASHWSFQTYNGGVYDEPACSSSQLDHAVTLVGYGTYQGTPAYIVKNSWGTGWGVSGYIYMSRNKNNQCGIATAAVIATGVANA